MVAGVVLFTGRTAVNRCFLRSLDYFRPGEQTADRNAEKGKGEVVRAATDLDLLGGQTLRRKEVLK